MLVFHLEDDPKAANAPMFKTRTIAPSTDSICFGDESQSRNWKFCVMIIEMAKDMLLSPLRPALMAVD
jgi:hypothetical protein